MLRRRKSLVNRLPPAAVALVASVALLFIAGATSAGAADDATAGPGGDWEAVNQVLEIPQSCTQDGKVISCDSTARTGPISDDASDGGDGADGDAAANDGSAVATAPSLDADSASGDAGSVNQGWGTLDEYENETVSAPVPIVVVSGAMTRGGGLSPRFTPMAMSHPLTSAARPLSPGGPWMIPPSAAWGRPAGSPIVMPGSPFQLH